MGIAMSQTVAEVMVGSVPNLTAYYDDFILLSGRVRDERLEKWVMLQAVANEEGPFESFEDFQTRVLREEAVDCRIFSVAGHCVDVVVPEAYAQELQEVRLLRLNHARLVRMKRPETEVLTALNLLRNHKYGLRVLPEDLVPILDQLPNTAYIPHIVLSHEGNPMDVWIRHSFDRHFSSAASTNEAAQTLLYRHERNCWLKVNIYHEWCHRLAHVHRDDAAMFYKALEIELYFYNWVPRPYAYRSWEEHWAVIGEELLDDSAKNFQETANNASLRTYIWMKTCEKALLDALLYRPSASGVLYLERVQCANQVLKQKALDVLVQIEAKLDADQGITEERKTLQRERLEAVKVFIADLGM